MKQSLIRILEPKDNAPESAFLLVKLLNAKISHSTLEKEMKEHPDYPSLLSISDILNNYNIENIVARFDNEKLSELPTPFITQVKGKKNRYQYSVIKEVGKDSVHFFDPEKQNWDIISKSAFVERTNGIVLLAETEDDVIEKDYEKKIREEKRLKMSQYLTALSIPLILLTSCLFTVNEFGSSAVMPMLFSIIILVGTFVTLLLFWYEIDQHNPFLQQICSSGRKTNCGTILNSKDAKIFGVSWSTIGFVYFAGSLILLLTLGITSHGALKVLSCLNALAVPYIFYSVYYQWKIAKQWCVLCLAVQSVLALQCLMSIAAGWHNLPLSNDDNTFKLFVQILTSFSIPFIASSLLIPALRKAKENGSLTTELQRLKHNPEIFNSLLEKQKLVSEYPHGLGILLGNPDATHKIIKVCNPYCGPCANAHQPMEDLLYSNSDLQIQIIFTASNDPRDVRSYPVKHLLAINDCSDEKQMHNALADWYLAEERSYESFSNKYPMNGELKKQDEKVEAMKEWCNKTDIQFTPTFFINGYQLPANYSVNDLKYFLSV